MYKNAVITLAIGHQPFWGLTQSIMQQYSKRISADFVVINSHKISTTIKESYKLEKFRLKDYLDQYERILFLDSDVAIHPNCPDLFERVSPEDLGAVCECSPYFNRDNIFQEAIEYYGVPCPQNFQSWFNTGVMVLSNCHRQLFTIPENIKAFRARNMDGSLAPERFTWLDMPLLNCLRIAHNIPLYNLGYSFNYLQPLAYTSIPPGQPEESWIFHGAGEDKSYLYRIIKQWYPELNPSTL